MTNKEWAERIIYKVDKKYKNIWKVYNKLLASYLTSNTIWIDCGCGENIFVKDFHKFVKCALGIDIINPVIYPHDFIQANINMLPLKNESVDLISLRFVVEHLENVNDHLAELSRVLKPEGIIIIITTNIKSPLIFIPKLLPFPLKNMLISKLFKISSRDILPTHHKFNSPGKFNLKMANLELIRMMYISDLNYERKWFFLILLFLHIITKPVILHSFRTNMIAILIKR
jgi:ubiquinone/menaquinone biosynthesis C-methylase UbiE